jgi:ABC-type uncharacterized transport system permease subunit
MDQNQSQPQNTSLFSMNLDAQNSYTLRSMASWGKVLGVVGLILGILFVIFGVIAQQAIRHSTYGYNYERAGFSGNTLATMGLAVYLVMGLVMIISSIFALNAGNKISMALKANNQPALNAGFAGARNYFAFWAVILIICLLFVFIGFIQAI